MAVRQYVVAVLLAVALVKGPAISYATDAGYAADASAGATGA